MQESPAESATGIDLAALEQLARYRDMGGFGITASPTGAYVKLADVIALARATPQHPACSHVWNDFGQLGARNVSWCPRCDTLAWTGKEPAATPQHSVTDQAQPALTVWYGPMPESNGKSNFTAVLMRKDTGWSGPHVTIERGEYPDRIRYEADRVRHLIGEISEEPDILAYDANKHSGYVKPDRTQPLASTAATQPEQADPAIADFEKWVQGRGPLGPGATPDRPFIAGWLAGNRRAQPEQASIETWQQRLPLCPTNDERWACMQAEIADLRAAFAIPASTAASEQQAGADERDAARYRYIEDHATTSGGGHGFTITCFVPVDHEDMGCGIDEAMAAPATSKESP